MTKTLRWRMATIAMVSLVSILAIIVAAINIVSYVNMRKDADSVLTVLLENGGQFTDKPTKPDSNERPTDPEEEKKEEISPETPYETRYFTALVNDETMRVKLDASQIVALREADIINYINTIYFGNKDRGFIGNYRFARQTTDGETFIVVVDWTKQMTAASTFLITSILISLIGAAVVFVLVLWLSKLAVKPIEAANLRQKRFITDSSHELKTPLAIISANTEVLEMEYGENEWTSSILHQVERLTSLTTRLTQLSRLDEPDAVMNTEILSLTSMVVEASDAFSTLAERGGLAFHVQAEEDIFVRGNQDLLSQTLSILLDNAIKYAKSSISVNLERRGNRVVFTAKNDVDAPLYEGEQEQFFHRFWRGDVSRSSETPGFGIGLSLARSIVEKQGGSLTAESPDGETVVMTLTLRGVEQ